MKLTVVYYADNGYNCPCCHSHWEEEAHFDLDIVEVSTTEFLEELDSNLRISNYELPPNAGGRKYVLRAYTDVVLWTLSNGVVTRVEKRNCEKEKK